MIILNQLSENLNLLMAKTRLNSSQLAKLTNLPVANIKRIRTNEHTNPTIATLLPIANFFSVTLDQLLGKDILFVEKHESEKRELSLLPLFLLQECNRFSLMNIKVRKSQKKIFTEAFVSPYAYGIKIEDNNIEKFPQGSILIVDPYQKLENGDYVIVTNTKSQIVFIKKYVVEIDQIYLKSLIDGVALYPLTDEDKILGNIIQFKVEFKNGKPNK